MCIRQITVSISCINYVTHCTNSIIFITLCNGAIIILVNAEHYGRAGANPKEYGNEIHCHVYTFAKFQVKTQPYLHVVIIIYYTCTIILYHRYYEYTISEKNIAQ